MVRATGQSVKARGRKTGDDRLLDYRLRDRVLEVALERRRTGLHQDDGHHVLRRLDVHIRAIGACPSPRALRDPPIRGDRILGYLYANDETADARGPDH